MVTIDPTERSKPPEASTIISPMAMHRQGCSRAEKVHDPVHRLVFPGLSSPTMMKMTKKTG